MQTFIERLARTFAYLGGATLAALIVLVCVSVVGRSLNAVLHSDILQNNLSGLSNWILDLGVGPITGDFEIVEAGMAFAIFAFLPICQLHNGHASVDIFTSRFSAKANQMLQLLVAMLFAAVLVLLAWYLTLGGLSKQRSGQTTFLLEFPVWWSYAASGVALWTAAIVSLYVAFVRTADLAMGLDDRLPNDGADH